MNDCQSRPQIRGNLFWTQSVCEIVSIEPPWCANQAKVEGAHRTERWTFAFTIHSRTSPERHHLGHPPTPLLELRLRSSGNIAILYSRLHAASYRSIQSPIEYLSIKSALGGVLISS